MKGNPFWNQQIPASSLDEARVAAPCPLCPSVSRGPAHKPQQGAWAVAAPGGRAGGLHFPAPVLSPAFSPPVSL